MNTASLSTELLRTVSFAEEVLRRVSSEESRAPILDGGWSRRQVLGHLIDSASNNHQRFVRASLQDSLEFPNYEPDDWSGVEAPEQVEWPLLVALWANYNRYLAHVIVRLPPAKMQVTCQIGENKPVTLQALAQDYLRHMLHHLGQIGAASTGGQVRDDNLR